MKVLIQTPPVDPTAAKLYVGNGVYSLIDKSNYASITRWRWHLRESSCRAYVCRKVTHHGKETIIYLHRWITHCPDHLEVHHLNGDTLDNRRCNLRIVDPSQHRQYRIFRQKPRQKEGLPTGAPEERPKRKIRDS